MFGLDPDTQRNIKAVFTKFDTIEKVILYGSRAKGNYKTGSDIDLTFFGQNLKLDVIYAIQDKLEELYLPYKFDLSIYARLDNPALQEHIQRVGQVFYQKKKGLPVGWQTKKLGDIAKIEKIKNSKIDLPYVGLEDIESDSAIFLGSRVPKKVKSPSFYFSTDHILYGRLRPYLNKILLPDFEGHCSTEIFPIKTTPKIEKRFLFYWFLQDKIIQKINKTCTGARMPRANMKDVFDFIISFPESLPEQHRLVTILDQAFADIAKAKQNAEKNLRNAREVFESYLQGIFSGFGNNWQIKKLGEVAEYFNGLTYSPKDVSNEGIIVLRSSNIQNDELNFLDIVRVNLAVKDKLIVKDGDILMCSRNGSKRLVGKTATIKNLEEVMTFGTFMMIIRSRYYPYLSWFFKSNKFRKQISGGENTMINQITRYMLDDIVFVFPPIETQNGIVQKLEALSAETKKLESIYKQKIAVLDELKKSILQKAFAGEL